MSIRTNQNEPTATECNRCDRLRSCISFTKMIHDSTGWRAQGTFTLCRNCLRRGRRERVKGELTELTRAIALRDAGLGETADFKHEEERAGDK